MLLDVYTMQVNPTILRVRFSELIVNDAERSNPDNYTIVGDFSNKVLTTKAIRVLAPNEPLKNYNLLVGRMSNLGAYVLTVSGTLSTPSGFVSGDLTKKFLAQGVPPTFRVIPESEYSLRVVFGQPMIVDDEIRDLDNYVFEGGLKSTGLEVVNDRTIRLYTTRQTTDTLYKLHLGKTWRTPGTNWDTHLGGTNWDGGMTGWDLVDKKV